MKFQNTSTTCIDDVPIKISVYRELCSQPRLINQRVHQPTPQLVPLVLDYRLDGTCQLILRSGLQQVQQRVGQLWCAVLRGEVAIGGTMVERGETPDIVGDLQIYNSDRDLDPVTNECQERDHPNPLFLGNVIPGSSKFQVCLNWWLVLYAVPHGTAGSTASMWWFPGLFNRVISGCRVDTGSEYLELHLRRPFVPSICWSFWITSALAIPNGYNIAH